MSKADGVETVASEATLAWALDLAWQALNEVRVKGKAQAVAMCCPVAPADAADAVTAGERRAWEGGLAATGRRLEPLRPQNRHAAGPESVKIPLPALR